MRTGKNLIIRRIGGSGRLGLWLAIPVGIVFTVVILARRTPQSRPPGAMESYSAQSLGHENPYAPVILQSDKSAAG